MLTWHYITRSSYDSAETSIKTSDKLFFLSDTKEIYRGTESFTESCIIYDEEPTIKAVNKIYINSTTLSSPPYAIQNQAEQGRIFRKMYYKTFLYRNCCRVCVL